MFSRKSLQFRVLVDVARRADQGNGSYQMFIPRPEIPFQQLSCEEIYSKVHEMTSPIWSEAVGGYHTIRHPCHFQDTVKSDVARLKEELSGLDLHDFKDRSCDGE
jgi:hypothetical protein